MISYRMLHNLRIRHRLFLGYAAVFLLAVASSLAVVLLVQNTLKKQAIQDQALVNQNLVHTLKAASEAALEHKLRITAEKNHDMLSWINSKVKQGEITSSQARSWGKELFHTQTIGKTGYIHVTDSQGIPQFHLQTSSSEIEKKNNPFLENLAMKNSGYSTYQRKSPGSGVITMMSAYTLYFKPWDLFLTATAPKSEITAIISKEYLLPDIAPGASGKPERQIIIDAQGTKVFSRNDRLPEDLPIKEILSLKTGRLKYRNSVQGDEMVAVFTMIPEYGWIAISTGHADKYAGTIGLISLSTLAITIVSMLFVLPLILKISASITDPLQTLMNYFSSGAIDDFNIRIEMDSKDEIGELAWYFNKFMNKLEVYSTGLKNKIMERQKAETSLKENKELFDAFMNNLPAMVFMKSSKGRYLYLNKAYRKAVAGDKQPNLPLKASDLWPKETVIQIDAVDRQVIKKNQAITTTEKVPIGDREEHFNITKFPVIQKNGPSLIAGIAFNITGKIQAEKNNKQLEQQLQQSQKMEAIGTLAGGIAHDFNNILAGIMGYAELALAEAPQGSRLPHKLNQILKASSRARDLVRQILTFSRHHQQEKKPVILNQIVKETLKLIKATLPSTIRIRFKSEDESPMIFADLTQIHQVLMNLLTNSAHAMHEKGGTLEVELSRKKIWDRRECSRLGLEGGHYVKISVKDNGPGIPPEILERIFDPFFTTKKICEGTGMGLSVVHGIVQSHQGAVDVKSSSGKGTSFHIYFPELTSSLKKEKTITLPPLNTNRHILYVDDEEMITDMAREILTAQGFRVTTVSDGNKALKLFELRPKRFDLVITDQTMPGMTGGELCSKMLEIRPEQKIVLSSGYNETMTSERARDAGFKAFLMKPFTSSELTRTISPLL